MSRPVVWVAGFDEAEAVARLMVAFRDHVLREWAKHTHLPSDNAFLYWVEKLLEHPDTEFLLGAPHADAPPAGVAQLRFRPSVWTAAEDAWLEDLYVTEDARGTGVGRALVELTKERARLRGSHRLQLDVLESNAGALALYESEGFTLPGAGERELMLTCRLGVDAGVEGQDGPH